MAEQAGDLQPLPGSDVVGRGIYLRPYQTYSLKKFLFSQDSPRPHPCLDTGRVLRIPQGYAVNESPPMPSERMLNQTVVEESWERFDKQLGVDVSVAASSQAFSIDAQASQSKNLRSEENAYYAMRSSFVPLWTVYLPSVEQLTAVELEDADIPTPFQHRHRWAYERFFSHYGTHYVRRAWVGGKANREHSAILTLPVTAANAA